MLAANDLRRLGATVIYAFCIIDREEGIKEKLAIEGITLVSFLTKRDFEHRISERNASM